ncbi:MAG: hypothetical protein EXS42_03240 [Lacunisphaera sp.]|nr:hypothetical protein [Lacunisphaera sp.]
MPISTQKPFDLLAENMRMLWRGGWRALRLKPPFAGYVNRAKGQVKIILRGCWIWDTYLSNKMENIARSIAPNSFPNPLPSMASPHPCKNSPNQAGLVKNEPW